MKKIEAIQTVRVELMTPEPRREPIDAKEMLKKLVEKHVAEILARREELLMQPFFEQARVSNEIRRLQTVPEQKKWAIYFSRYGCLRCGARDVPHCTCGMCAKCSGLTRNRLGRIVKQCERAAPDPPELCDQDEVARQALPPALKALNPAKRSKQ
jgi:hypothetical protein